MVRAADETVASSIEQAISSSMPHDQLNTEIVAQPSQDQTQQTHQPTINDASTATIATPPHAMSTPVADTQKTQDVPPKTENNPQKNEQFLAEKLTDPIAKPHTKKSTVSAQEQTVAINYDNEDLVDIINHLSALKGVNIMLPQGANAIAAKVTLRIQEKLALSEAWKLLYTLLDIAGYSIEPRPDMYVIKKNSPDITRDPLPLYIGTQPHQLPDTDQRIRYIYYLSNIKLTDDDTNEIKVVLANLLPLNTSAFKIDTTTNGVIISAKANDVKAAMKIIVDLDKIDFQESLEVVNLRYTTAATVASLFNDTILKNSDVNKYHLNTKQHTEVTFFSRQVRLINNDTNNTLFILGRPQATQRVKDFILNHVDVELDSGKSILHVYQLQYSRAEDLAGVLQTIVTSASQGGTGQSSLGGVSATGAFRTFGEVIIKPDYAPGGDSKYYGGNKLIVAARQSDWKAIEKLITELDKPQAQVFLEILICDLSTDDQRIVGAMLRDPLKIPLPGTSQFQADNIGYSGTISGVTPTGAAILSNCANGCSPVGPIVPTTSLQADLLQNYYNGVGSTPVSVDQFLSQNAVSGQELGGKPGSTIISMSDNNGATWGLLQILQSFDNTKVLSHPHVLATNGQLATVKIGQQKYLQDESVGSGGTTTTIKIKPINADLTVMITPRISSANTVHLEISIDIESFVDITSQNPERTTRKVVTNALVRDKDILTLGGLIQDVVTQSISETPILSKIPILGWLFKSRNNDVAKNNLTVFISPTIIQSRLHSGVSDYTKDYVQLAKDYASDGALFDSLQDPVTRWFFRTDIDAPTALNEFVAQDEILTKAKIKNKRTEKKEAKKSKTSLVPQNAKVAENIRINDPVWQLKQLQELIAQDSNPLLST